MSNAGAVQGTSARMRGGASCGLAAAIALLGSAALYHMIFVYPLHDQSWYLYAAQQVLRGTQLYGPHLTETNPPMIVWFSMLPDVLAHLLHVTPLRMLQVVVDLLLVLSSLWTVRLLRAAGVVQGTGMSVLAFVATLAVEASTTNVEFGQREQMVVAMMLPYLAGAVSGAVLDVSERIALGVFAALGICFKPQQALVLVGLEMVLVLWRHSLRGLVRVEFLAMIAGGAGYVLAVKLGAPLYLSSSVPLLRDTYWAYGQMQVSHLIALQWHFHVLSLATLLVWAWRRPTLLVPVAPLALIVCSLCASVAYYLQRSWWSYKSFPQRSLLYFAMVWLAAEAVRRGVAGLQLRRRFVAATAILFAVMFSFFARHGVREVAAANAHGRDEYQQTVLEAYPEGTRVYVMSTSLYGFRYVLEDRLVWASRYAHLWMLPAIVLNQEALAGGPVPEKVIPRGRVEQLAEMQRETLAEDLRLRRPEVVLVELCSPTHACQGLAGLPLNLLVWFQQSRAFATEWGRYHRQQGNAEWDVYRRVD